MRIVSINDLQDLYVKSVYHKNAKKVSIKYVFQPAFLSTLTPNPTPAILPHLRALMNYASNFVEYACISSMVKTGPEIKMSNISIETTIFHSFFLLNSITCFVMNPLNIFALVGN